MSRIRLFAAVLISVLVVLFGIGLDAKTLRPVSATDALDRAKYAAVSAATKTAADVAILGKPAGEALLDNLRNNAGTQMQAAGASHLGHAYQNQELSYLEHKLAHAGLGGGGAIVSGNESGSAALGAAVAEYTGEAAFLAGFRPENAADIGKITGATSGLLGGDVNSASTSANNAVENNFVHFAAHAVRTCAANPACASLVRDGMAVGVAAAMTIYKGKNPNVEGFDIADVKNKLPGFTPETSEASVLTTPAHQDGVKTLATPEHTYDPEITTEGFAAIPDWLRNFGSVLKLDAEVKNIFSPINKGPLPDDIVKTFRGGVYKEYKLTQDLEVYRVYGGTAKQQGSFWTTIKPLGSLQAKMDLALKKSWGNTAEHTTSMVLPRGTIIYHGLAAPQGDVAIGGGEQVFIPNTDDRWGKK